MGNVGSIYESYSTEESLKNFRSIDQNYLGGVLLLKLVGKGKEHWI